MSALPPTDSTTDVATSKLKQKKTGKKAVVTEQSSFTLPSPLFLAADYHAYMSKHQGQALSFEQVIQKAVIDLVDQQAKSGIQLPPMMVAGFEKFKATHPAYKAPEAE